MLLAIVQNVCQYNHQLPNWQFFVLPNEVVDNLREKGVSFEDWGIRGEKETTVRFVTSWATIEADVEELVERLK